MLDFKNMSYVEFISFIKETNRCPGGKDTINWILQNSFANKDTRALEVGSNTGFSSLEVARSAKCRISGIEVVPEAVAIANHELSLDTEEIQKLVDFQTASAYDIPFEDNTFDLIIAGGSTSFMDDKSKAINEMERVLKPWGFLSVTNLFYDSEPPKKVLDKVSEVIGVQINPLKAHDWINVYTQTKNFEIYKLEQVTLSDRSIEEIDAYIEFFLNKPHIAGLTAKEKSALQAKWKYILEVFNENHKYLGFIRALLRKRHIEEEPELFKLD